MKSTFKEKEQFEKQKEKKNTLQNKKHTRNENGGKLTKPITLLNEVTGPLAFATPADDTSTAATVLEGEIEARG